jgi:hypothetical protein
MKIDLGGIRIPDAFAFLALEVITVRLGRRERSTRPDPGESDFPGQFSCRDGLTFRAFHCCAHDDSLACLSGLGDFST